MNNLSSNNDFDLILKTLHKVSKHYKKDSHEFQSLEIAAKACLFIQSDITINESFNKYLILFDKKISEDEENEILRNKGLIK